MSSRIYYFSKRRRVHSDLLGYVVTLFLLVHGAMASADVDQTCRLWYLGNHRRVEVDKIVLDDQRNFVNVQEEANENLLLFNL